MRPNTMTEPLHEGFLTASLTYSSTLQDKSSGAIPVDTIRQLTIKVKTHAETHIDGSTQSRSLIISCDLNAVLTHTQTASVNLGMTGKKITRTTSTLALRSVQAVRGLGLSRCLAMRGKSCQTSHPHGCIHLLPMSCRTYRIIPCI